MQPTAGLMVIHDGAAIEFLHRVRLVDGGAVWYVRPLFVEAMPREVVVFDTDRITPLHSKSQ